MPVLQSASDEAFLSLMWSVTLAFCVMSLLALSILIIRRFGRERRERRYREAKTRFRNYLIAAMDAPGHVREAAVGPKRRRDITPAADAGLEVLRAVGGGEASDVAMILKSWGMERVMRRWLARGPRSKKLKALPLLAKIGGETGLELVARKVASRDVYVQLAALRSLAAVRAIGKIDVIVTALSKSKAVNDRILTDILTRFPAEAAPKFMELGMMSADLRVRVAALRACVRLKHRAAPREAAALFADPAPEIRIKALELAAQLDPRIAALFLKKAFEDDAIVRVHAARITGEIGLDRFAGNLARGLEDPNWWMRYRSAEALWRLGDKGRALLANEARDRDSGALISAQVLEEGAFNAA